MYEESIDNKLLKEDLDQLEIVEQLDHLNKQLIGYTPEKPSLLDKLFNRTSNKKQNARVKGVYLWGSVGCGKTMLMDLFYENCSVDKNVKRRVHFHSFMIDFHNSKHF